MKRRLRVRFDQDGIVTDLYGRLLQLHNSEHGDNATIADITDWHIRKVPRIAQYEGWMEEVFNRPGFWLGLDAIPGAVEGLKELHEAGHDIQMVTTPWSPLAAYEKHLWFQSRTPFLPFSAVNLVHDKTPFEADVFVDDAAHNLVPYRRRWRQSILLSIQYPFHEGVMDQLKSARVILTGQYHESSIAAWRNIVNIIHLLSQEPEPRSA